jgi:hypothetical protein
MPASARPPLAVLDAAPPLPLDAAPLLPLDAAPLLPLDAVPPLTVLDPPPLDPVAPDRVCELHAIGSAIGAASATRMARRKIPRSRFSS